MVTQAVGLMLCAGVLLVPTAGCHTACLMPAYTHPDPRRGRLVSDSRPWSVVYSDTGRTALASARPEERAAVLDYEKIFGRTRTSGSCTRIASATSTSPCSTSPVATLEHPCSTGSMKPLVKCSSLHWSPSVSSLGVLREHSSPTIKRPCGIPAVGWRGVCGPAGRFR